MNAIMRGGAVCAGMVMGFLVINGLVFATIAVAQSM